jgi:rubrerythrin
MYSKEALSDIFQRILAFEQDIKPIYEDCIENIDDEHIINILQEICKEEEVHIELAKELFKIIDKD